MKIIYDMKKLLVLVLIWSFLSASNLSLLNGVITQSPENVYQIEPGDVLEIMIFGEEELSRTVMVMHNGTISYPLIGEARVAGLTTDQAATLLAAKLTKYFTRPTVSIILKSPSQPYVSVFGEVLRPGAVEYQRGLRVTDYIALAGGPSPNANLKNVKVVRFSAADPSLTKITVIDIDVNKILEKGLTQQNYELKAGDWISISKKFTINWTAVLQFATLVVAGINLYYTIQKLD